MKNLIRYFKDSDADEVSTLVCRNLREVNSKDYPPNIIEKITEGFTSDKIQHFARQREMFVMENEGKIVGTASLVRDTKTEDEQYACLTLFVLPEWHGKGIGKQLMNRIEESAKCKGSKVLQVPASLTSISFYRKVKYHR